MPLIRHPLVVALGCLALALVVFSPRLWVLRQPVPGSFQWDRGLTFLKQAVDPFRQDIEPAMRWRQLPALVSHYAGLRGKSAFLLPVLGVLAATAAVAVFAARHDPSARFVWGCTLLFASSSAALVPLHWWGVNDGWMWLGLLAAAFAQGRAAPGAAMLLCPWIDERFLLAAPLALLARVTLAGGRPGWRDFLPLAWALPYVLARCVAVATGGEGASSTYLAERLAMLAGLAPFAPLGWWMALRAGWVAAGYAIGRNFLLMAAASLATLAACFAIASDMSRSAAVMAPVMLAGCFAWRAARPETAARDVWRLAFLNLLLPAAHVVHTHIDLISPLPLELLRLWRIPA
jgi:hypothetical protein